MTPGERFAASPALRALRHPSFRIFYAGQFVSLLGNWMQTVATAWLVYRLSGSAFLLGLSAFALQIPVLLLAPIAGVVADRTNRRRLLIVVQSAALVQAVVLAGLTYLGAIQVWQVIALSLWLGLVNAVETPARQAFLLELIADRSDLPNAIALNSFLFNTTRLVGPSLAGLVLAAAGEGLCFALNAASYFAILLAYKRVRSERPYAPSTSTAPWADELFEGFRFAFGSLVIRRLLILLAALGFFTAPWQTLLPIFVSESFGGDSRTFGFLIGSVGMGAIVGTVWLARRASVRGLGNVIRTCVLLAAFAMIAFAFAQAFWQALVILPIFGLGLILSAASTNQILQTIAEDRLRGRIVSMYVTTFMGVAPIGNFLGGTLAEAIGAHTTFLVNGVGLAIAGAWFIRGLPEWRAALREQYLAQGVNVDR